MPVLAKDLRAAVLQAAIQGKLTQQLPEDGDARDLLAQIKAEKEQLIKNKKIKKDRPLEPIKEDDVSFDIPDNWCWVRFGEIITLLSGADLSPSEYNSISNGIPYITGASNIENNSVIINRWTSSPKNIAYKDNLLLTCKGTVGKTVFLKEEKAHIARQIMSITIYSCDRNFIKLIVDAQIEYLKSKAKSMIPGIERSNVLNIVCALPPLAEQHRIVARIEELMALIDEYEKIEKQLVELKEKFPGDMKAALLQAAIQGKLTKQLPEDGDANDLLAKIKAEKEQLIKDKKIKKEKPFAPLEDDGIPFDIPNNWCWCKYGDIGRWGAGATPAKGEIKYYQNGTIPWLVTGELNNGFVSDIKGRITEYALNKTSVKLNPVGSVLIAMYGATIGKLGILDVAATTNQACCACETFKGVYNKYLFYSLMTNKDKLSAQADGAAQPNISKEKIIAFPFALPPLTEQKRIVEILDKLLPMCDELTE